MGELIPFGGLRALEADQRVPLEGALSADDLYLDDATIRGRNGYRSVLPASTTIGLSGEMPQLLYRFRTSDTSARTVVVAGGYVYLLTDPSSDLASDGTLTSLGSAFGATAKISAAQVGGYLYLCSDESGVAWRRIKPDYTMETLTYFPDPNKPTSSFSSLSMFVYRSEAGLTYTDSNLQRDTTVMLSTWFNCCGIAGATTDPPAGAYTQIKLAANADWSGAEWVLFVLRFERYCLRLSLWTRTSRSPSWRMRRLSSCQQPTLTGWGPSTSVLSRNVVGTGIQAGLARYSWTRS